MPFAHLTIATRDVPRTSRFFQAAFGWPQIHRPDNAPLRVDWLEIAPGQQLHVLEVADFAPSPFEQEFGRHVALFHPGGEMQALQERLVALGAELVAPLRPTPFPRFFFRDFNGYLFEVIDQDAYVRE